MDDRKPEFDNQSQDPDERWEEAARKGVQEGLRRWKERQAKEHQDQNPPPEPEQAERLGKSSEPQTTNEAEAT